MKKIYKTIVFSLILTLFSIMIFNQNNFNVVAYTNSVSEIIMDVNSGRVLFENNAYEKKYMASTTKILTAICIIENCNISDVITVTDKTVGVEGSSIYLEVGEKLSVKDLLYGLMLRSGNDCAETLAVYCSGSIEKFSLLMNETAKKIGALNSNFVNPHGLHNDNHYTTAYDLALISR
ncbi:MAG: D-alanyl-D-alanine carboxypeptidase, partial [Clostridia bacterium]|nr:D-alanyl-D-alanine carboxypeptidase [Clostridia bacterium]